MCLSDQSMTGRDYNRVQLCRLVADSSEYVPGGRLSPKKGGSKRFKHQGDAREYLSLRTHIKNTIQRCYSLRACVTGDQEIGV